MIISVSLTLWEGSNETLNEIVYVKSVLEITNGNVYKIPYYYYNWKDGIFKFYLSFYFIDYGLYCFAV